MTIPTSSPGVSDPAPAATIKAQAIKLGFDACRITAAALPDSMAARLQAALAAGHHGSMAWMETRTAERSHPQALWPAAQSVLMLGMNYGPDQDPLPALARRDRGTISVYAQNEDYHDVIKKRLKQLGRWMCATYGCEIKVFVDTAPVMEKPLAAQAGLGWQGKHTNLVSRDFGAWLFLGAIYTDMPLPEDTEETDHCGRCTACLDICPTQAFPSPHKLDARRCISYLTIEHHGTIPREFRAAMGNRIYGCDDCLAICPWNKFAEAAQEAKLVARDALRSPALCELAGLDDPAFRELFRKSPVKRIGRDRFVRNVMVAIGNSNDPGLLEAVEPRLDDPAPVVQAMAVWAWRQLGGDPSRLTQLAQTATDPGLVDVLAEVQP